MDRLEQYIKDNRSEFEVELPSTASKSRFMSKAAQQQSRTRKFRFIYSAVSVAAVMATAFIGISNLDSFEIGRLYQKMTVCENEIFSLVESTCPEDMKEVSNTIRIITDEAIPLESLLPDELEARERRRILDEYYSCKIDALERVKERYMNINEL